jgi:hypothetical protein
MPVAPDVQNYHIGKGIVSFKETAPTVAAGFLDLGNAPSFVWEPTIEKLEHFSSREGVKTKDFTAVTQVGATITITIDEITKENVRLFCLGEEDPTPDLDGNITVGAFKNTEIVGEIKLEGTNDIGQHVGFTGTISIVPSGQLSLITAEDEFTTIELTAEVQKDASGNFGKFSFPDESVMAATASGRKVRAKAPPRPDETPDTQVP